MNGVTYIYYKVNSQKTRWGVGAHPGQDTSETLKTHLKKWIPNSVFIKADYHDENNEYIFTYGPTPNKSFVANC